MPLTRFMKIIGRAGILLGLILAQAGGALKADVPEATITAPTGAVTVAKSLTIPFTATSTDSTGFDSYVVNSFSWTFGDGTTGSGASTSHAYGTTGTYTATLTVSYKGGTYVIGKGTKYTTCSATATRVITVVNQASIASFATSATQDEAGKPVTLTWVTANATSVSITGVSGSLPVSGSVSVSPTANTTYTLTANGVGPSATSSVTVSTYVLVVTISPGSASIPLGGAQAFTGRLAPANRDVTWSSTGGSMGAGSGSAGTYSDTFTGTASGSFSVKVASMEDPSVTASATVLVQTVSIGTPVPAIAGTYVGGTATFRALVANAVNTGVNWSVSGGGTISGSGVFTAALQGTWTVTATSQADPTKSSTAQVQVMPLAVAVSPAAVTVKGGQTQQFTGTVSGPGNPSQAVTWSVVSANGGSISSGGLYTAPTAPGDYTVQAVSGVDGSLGTATVHVPGWKLVWQRDIIYMGTKEVAEIDGAGVHVTQVDHLGSPRFVTNTVKVEATQKFLPFGETLDVPTGTLGIGKGYTDHEQTDPSGLVYMQARFYAPQYHRFSNPDPGRDQHFEDTQSWNIYSYVRNQPTMQIDPTGMLLVCVDGNELANNNYDLMNGTRDTASMTTAPKTQQLPEATDGSQETAQTDQKKNPANLQVSDSGKKFIAANEGGDKGKVYKDSNGNPTAGVGHLLTADEQKKYAVGTDVPGSVRAGWLDADLKGTVSAVQTKVTVNVFQKQFDALVDFAFNVGAGAFGRSQLLKDVNGGSATADTIKTDFAGWSKGGAGIPARRDRETELYNNGVY